MAARAFILATTYSRHAPKAQNGLSDTPAGIEQGGAFRLVMHGDHVSMSFCRAPVRAQSSGTERKIFQNFS
uniref:Uncharacterized protein n=1 Tax=uncultured prokaryote TaxID=198431 RepID=A0A0H5PWT2_9ZZZZ|nr:hypothetical protein [uncultured prokaryote]